MNADMLFIVFSHMTGAETCIAKNLCNVLINTGHSIELKHEPDKFLSFPNNEYLDHIATKEK